MNNGRNDDTNWNARNLGHYRVTALNNHLQSVAILTIPKLSVSSLKIVKLGDGHLVICVTNLDIFRHVAAKHPIDISSCGI